MADQDKKLIIDESWKEQAQREKEVLVAKEKEEKDKQAAEEQDGDGPLPPGTFAALVSMLTTQALFALGLIRVRGEEERGPDLEMARYNIDMLEMLSEKTKGNLTPEEQKMLKSTLSDLRMGFVSVVNQIGGQEKG
ncbi:MAG TPA: DUF1844 domain-containing protein [Sedimentisphaerales bacterium]|nr:DUF1844 domain-containing protein [Sedimentisphaerales bacterium]